MSVELVHIIRGHQVESIHRGDIVAVNQHGEIVFAYGDPYKKSFWRSSAKPFQVIPFIEAGGLNHFNITTEELALMTSSHGGEKRHVEAVINLLMKMGLTIEALDCGEARPMFAPYANYMLQSGQNYTQANNPCSGKHASMIGYGLIKGIRLNNYIDKSHPIQLKMLDTISRFTGLPPSEIDVAIDGCGVPVFGMPICNMALAYTQLASDDWRFKKIAQAMTQAPFYVAGSKRLDTIIMEETQERILAKLGAESVYCMTILDKGIGIAIKIEDGSYRALDALIPDLLHKYSYITQEEYSAIRSRLKLNIYNHRKEVVGNIQSILA